MEWYDICTEMSDVGITLYGFSTYYHPAGSWECVIDVKKKKPAGVVGGAMTSASQSGMKHFIVPYPRNTSFTQPRRHYI